MLASARAKAHVAKRIKSCPLYIPTRSCLAWEDAALWADGVASKSNGGCSVYSVRHSHGWTRRPPGLNQASFRSRTTRPATNSARTSRLSVDGLLGHGELAAGLTRLCQRVHLLQRLQGPRQSLDGAYL